MTPQEFKQARRALGYSQQALANEFDMGINGGRTIRRWESGQCPVNPIAAYALMLMPMNGDVIDKKSSKSSFDYWYNRVRVFDDSMYLSGELNEDGCADRYLTKEAAVHIEGLWLVTCKLAAHGRKMARRLKLLEADT